MDYKKELDLLKEVTKNIYDETEKKAFESNFKGEQDIVTTTDIFIEKALVKVIKNKFPNDHFHTEEFYHETNLKDRTWLIDPIDGTSNYAAHLNLFVVQIALYDKGDIVLSYVYMPKWNKTYYAIKGQGAYLNDKIYHVDDHKQSSSFMMTMVGLTQDKDDQLYFNKLINLAIEHKYKIRMLGSIGLEMALASEGVYDFLYTNVTNYWDIFPGILLLKEAGAKIYNELGQDYQIGDVHMFSYKSKQVKEIINKYI